MLEGSSIDEKIAEQVYDFAKGKKRIMVLLDSMHTHDHVLTLGNPAEVTGWMCECGHQIKFQNGAAACDVCGRTIQAERGRG